MPFTLQTLAPGIIVRLTLPSPKERIQLKREAKVLSFGEDLGEAKREPN